MAILSLTEVPELKKLAESFGYTIHLHDACGGQSFQLEASGEETSDSVFPALEEFFSARRMSVFYFGEDKLNFIAK